MNVPHPSRLCLTIQTLSTAALKDPATQVAAEGTDYALILHHVVSMRIVLTSVLAEITMDLFAPKLIVTRVEDLVAKRRAIHVVPHRRLHRRLRLRHLLLLLGDVGRMSAKL